MRFLLLALTLAACQAEPPAEPVAAVSARPTVAASPAPARNTVSFGTHTIPVEIADTPESRRKGLSGRPSLAENTGLVLAWPTPTQVAIWMPEMRFAIDVVFVRDAKVVAIYPDAKPCPDTTECPTFGPDIDVDYVLEVPAGSTARWGLEVGDPIRLDARPPSAPPLSDIERAMRGRS